MRPTAGIGAVLVVLAAATLAFGTGNAVGTPVSALLVVLALFGVVTAVWKLLGSPDRDDRSIVAAPWTDDGALFDRPPERTRDDDVLSGESFAAILAEAGETARAERSLDAGFETVRPILRRALADALAMRAPRSEAEQAIEAGSWTDDPVAAAVLEPTCSWPPRSFRQRIEAWLFPERVVRRQLQRAVQAIAATGARTVPNVPGQNAPRSVPVIQPTLEDLQRGVDGRVQRAVDPLGTARGPRPPGQGEVPIGVGDRADGEAGTGTDDDRAPDRADDDRAPDRADEASDGHGTTADRDLFVRSGDGSDGR